MARWKIAWKCGSFEDMNWIKTINDFYQYVQLNPLSASSISLFHGLLYLSSRGYWPESIAPRMETLSSVTGLSRKTIERSRRELMERNLISYEPKSGNRSGSYTIFQSRYWYMGATPNEIAEALSPEPEPIDINDFRKLRYKWKQMKKTLHFRSVFIFLIFNQPEAAAPGRNCFTWNNVEI